jgi:hypothetical protein
MVPAIIGVVATSPAYAADGLDGKTKIREVKLLAPQEGRQEGQLLVWVRAEHAIPTAPAAAGDQRLRNRGKISVSVQGLGTRSARERLCLVPESGRSERGYLMRFANPGPLGSKPLRKLRVEVTARQNLRLGRDGDVDATRSDEHTETIRPHRIDEAITPQGGNWYATDGSGGEFNVDNNAITEWSSSTMPVAGEGYAPVDPENGSFNLTVSESGIGSIVFSGNFLDDTEGTGTVVVNIPGEGIDYTDTSQYVPVP